MSLHFYTLDQCPANPWKNGGGTTREIVCWPPASTMDDFEWRISIADIAMDGPFSAFAGIDRTIMLLSGGGVQLRATDGSIDHCLSARLAPFHFSGDTALDCTLIDGATQDFNIMARRDKWHADTMIVRDASQIATSNTGLVFVASGTWHIQLASAEQSTMTAITVDAGQGFWWRSHTLDLSLTPAGNDAAIVMTQLQERT